jgi:Flp pilus assembly protein TadG
MNARDAMDAMDSMDSMATLKARSVLSRRKLEGSGDQAALSTVIRNDSDRSSFKAIEAILAAPLAPTTPMPSIFAGDLTIALIVMRWRDSLNSSMFTLTRGRLKWEIEVGD